MRQIADQEQNQKRGSRKGESDSRLESQPGDTAALPRQPHHRRLRLGEGEVGGGGLSNKK